MAKNQTPWSNNDIKPSTSWANNDVKPSTAWGNNITKNTTTYTPVSKNDTDWNLDQPAYKQITYNDVHHTYNDSLLDYNFMPNQNTENQKLETIWSQVV